MTIFNRKARILCTAFAGTALFVAACGDDSTDPPSQVLVPDGGDDPDASGNGGNGGNGGTDAGNGGTSTDLDASDGSVPGQVQFTVPANGGDVDLPVGDETITFTFPDSVAGEVITLTLADAGDIGWEADDFTVLIEMQPDGLTFDPPVIVTPSSGELIALSFPQGAGPSAPEQLELAANGSGFELHHFSYLGFNFLGSFCGSVAAEDSPNSQRCVNEGPNSTFRVVSCHNYRFCSQTDVYCCVQPGDAGGSDCDLNSAYVGYSFNTVADVTGDFPYCGAVVEEDGGIIGDLDASGDASADGGLMTCNEAIADLAGSGPSAVSCSPAGGVTASCVAALDWQLGVTCNSFCASIGLGCVYDGEASGAASGSGVASCSDSFNQPNPATQYCDTNSDADHWCHCN